MTYTIEQLDDLINACYKGIPDMGDKLDALSMGLATQLRDALATIERIEAWFWEHDGKMMDIDYDMFWPQTKQALNK